MRATEIGHEWGRAARTSRPRLSVGVVLADNFTLSAFSLFVDTLRLAADEGDRSRPIQARWSIMSARPEPVRASCGVTVSRTGGLIEPGELDYVAVVGGLLHAGRQVDEETTAYLRRAAKAGVTMIGLCTGSFILCRAGLMQARRCCVSWYHYQDFLDEFPDEAAPVADRLFLEDGNRITCAGGGGTVDLATFLVERHLGRNVAQKARQVMLFDRARAGDDAQPHPPLADLIERVVPDTRVRRAVLMMEQNLADPVPIATIAARLDVSARQLERMFHRALGQGPAMVYRAIRLRYARWLLDSTNWSVTDIALAAGFTDCAHFSRQYKEHHGFSPSISRAERRQGGDGPQSRVTMAGVRVFG